MTDTHALVADSAIDRIFGPVVQPQTWINILYLLASFPLGVLYFCILMALLSTGLSFLPLFVGVFVLWFGVVVCDILANVDRAAANTLLGAGIPERAPAVRVTGGVFERMIAAFKRPGNFKRIVYLFLRFPMGLLSFILVCTLLPMSVMFLTAPLTYTILPIMIGTARVETFDEAIYLCCFGAVFTLVTVHVLKSWASVCRRFAQGMLTD